MRSRLGIEPAASQVLNHIPSPHALFTLWDFSASFFFLSFSSSFSSLMVGNEAITHAS